MSRFIVCDSEKCLGCRICEFVCPAVKEKKFDPSLSRIQGINFEPKASMAIACLLCEKPLCVEACPRSALRKDENGIIRVDENRCNGCHWCINVCNFGAIAWHPTKGVVMTCDLCDGDPECVKLCPFEALSLTTTEEVAHKFRKAVLEKLLQQSVTATPKT
jgi:Fe-S-cluster-containing hydrogenase component 2